MKKISNYFLAIALLWCCNLAVADMPTTSGNPNQREPVEKSVENPSAITTHVVGANPEIARTPAKIDPALTPTNAGGPVPEITRMQQNSNGAAKATNPNYIDPEKAKLLQEKERKPSRRYCNSARSERHPSGRRQYRQRHRYSIASLLR